MNDSLKHILLELVAEVEDLRANQGLVNLLATGRISTGAARETKGLALKEHTATFDTLRKRIGELA